MLTEPVQLSAALIPTVVWAGIADEQLTVTGAGQLIVGATLSNTVIVCAQVAVFEQASLATNVRTTVYLFAQITFVVWSPTTLTVGVPTQLSTADTPLVVDTGTFEAKVTVILAGQLMLGATLSFTVIT